jgi:hypothetical protein
VILGRRFAKVIDAQLRLFEREHAALIRECERAEAAYDDAPRDEAEERYGDYMDLVDEGRELLDELRDHYAATLDERTAERYEAAFDRAVRRRLSRFATGSTS